jgi:dolichyl-diphosphooligosaccharide--protein glycosyltransferase
MLGAADYHCWEILLFVSIIMFSILALKGRPMYWIGALEVLVIYWFSWAGALIAPLMIVSGILLFAFLRLKAWYLKGLVALLYTGIGITAYFVNPVLFKTGLSMFTWDLTQTNLEMMPLFFSQGQFNIDVMWAYFGPVYFFALFGLGWFGYRTVRYKRSEDCLFFACSIIGMLLMFSMRRFEYYWAFNACLLAVFACVEYLKPYIEKKEKFITNLVAIVLIVCVIPASISVQGSIKNQFVMTKDWHDTCQWLQTQSSKLAYYAGEQPNYGVFTWWNYGYYLITEGHQAVMGTPGYADGHRASQILTDNDTAHALSQLKEHKMKYIIVDKSMIDRDSYSIMTDAGVGSMDSTFMQKLYFSEYVEGVNQVQEFGEVKVFEIKP